MSLRSKIEEILLGFNFTYGVNEGSNPELAKEIREGTIEQLISLFDQTLKEVVGEMENEGKGNYILTLTRIVRNTLKQDQLARWEKLK